MAAVTICSDFGVQENKPKKTLDVAEEWIATFENISVETFNIETQRKKKKDSRV